MTRCPDCGCLQGDLNPHNGKCVQHGVRLEPRTVPPLGLRPRYIADEARADEIVAAMRRYVSTGTDIPYVWVAEFLELLDRKHSARR